MKERLSHSRARHEQERMERGVEALLRADIPDQFKVLAILAFTGVKPASRLDLPYREYFFERIENIRQALKSFGVAHEESIVASHGGQRIIFSIARDPVALEQLRALDSAPHTKHSASWHQLYGTLLGFPKTAVDAFVHHRDGMTDAPDEIRHTELGRFYDEIGGFRLSKTHWREEIKTVEKWMNAIRSVSPEYLAKIISDAPPAHQSNRH